MMTRILTVALAIGTLAAGTAYAQTGSSTTTPSTPPSTSTMPSTSGSGSTGATVGGSTSTQQAQQPMGAFDPTKYKTKSECLTAAAAAKASTSLCASLK